MTSMTASLERGARKSVEVIAGSRQADVKPVRRQPAASKIVGGDRRTQRSDAELRSYVQVGDQESTLHRKMAPRRKFTGVQLVNACTLTIPRNAVLTKSSCIS
ncbi:hypothetical protein KC19_2G283300 [Ceratodon purpureus]|uniref:Uncharacterized protein n=1 Tax=Ceratodon purpureus TaxID=3225 RepID=A0A8T0J1I8_CERPU|nr:hypothetical protein KC19_2G283000 [Ceratodon purpureus]KAG0588987.1 hypothetical protein KC19_2G283100 [Ceratodon purpureus]KAG0588988.1 hypothetical protein KC19_2G283200 [Ceratodon purpureus]KAG0588989.1 hypothetical protein KC19_2G283300 [Ceratodon purpureus]